MFGVLVVVVSALLMDGGLPDRERPLVGGGAGRKVVDVDVGEVIWLCETFRRDAGLRDGGGGGAR